MNDFMIECSGVCKSYASGSKRLDVLRGIDWTVRRGEWVTLLGASGSGKTTFLNLLGLLERPDTGTLAIDGADAASLSARSAAAFRREKIGFVFQSYHLLPELSLCENVMLPARMAGMTRANARKAAEALLSRVGLTDRQSHSPSELSGGEQQRGAIARALINNPELLLADEPTGNLDARTGDEILALFADLRREKPERTIVLITHNEAVARLGDRVSRLSDGLLS